MDNLNRNRHMSAADADESKPQGNGSVEMYNAITKCDFRTVHSLFRRGFNPDGVLNESTRLTALIYATVKGNLKIVKLFIHFGASLNSKDCRGMTPVMYSCCYNNDEILCALKDAGADLTLQDHNGKTALHHAAQTGSFECLTIILDYPSFDISQIDSQGKSAVMYAVCSDKTACLAYLILNKSIKIDLVDNDGNSPLILALHLRKIEHAKILLDNGAEVNLINNKGKTALSKVFEQSLNERMLELASIILIRGAKPNLNPADELYLHEMIALGKKKIVRLMLINGCSPRMKQCKQNCFKFDISQELSPLAVALLSNQHSIARYLLANIFLTQFDIESLPNSQEIASQLLNNGLLKHCQLLHKAISCYPFSLFALSFNAVSNLLYNRDYKFKTESQQLILSKFPTVIQKRLQFKSDLAYLCVSEWETLPLMFDARYKFPITRPFSHFWPIGHKLTRCNFPCCNNFKLKGYRILKKDLMDDVQAGNLQSIIE